MLAYWRQHSSSLAYKWGVLEYEAEETERPQFTGACAYIYTYMCIHSYRHITITHIACMYIGKSVYDEENDEWTKEYSTWRRFVLKYTISTPVLICFILVVLSAMLSFFRSHDQMIASYNAGRDIEYFSSSSSSSSSTTSMSEQQTEGTTTEEEDISIHLTMSALSRSDFWAVLLLYPSLYGILIGVCEFRHNYY